MIEVRSLTKAYADLRRGQIMALDDVTFQARPARSMACSGPTGPARRPRCGSSARCSSRPAARRMVAGFDCQTQPELVRHQIGFISANTAVYDRMTAWEMVEYFGRLYGMDEEELRERMELLFDRFGMKEIRDVLGAKMSTGMKQKVSIARAIVHDPPVLIFDEATTGLDVLVARALLDTVAELRDEGKCIVFSTHIMREAERLCDRIAIMHRGRILAEGTLAELSAEHGEPDLEELFFRLIRKQEAEHPVVV